MTTFPPLWVASTAAAITCSGPPSTTVDAMVAEPEQRRRRKRTVRARDDRIGARPDTGDASGWQKNSCGRGRSVADAARGLQPAAPQGHEHHVHSEAADARRRRA